MIIKSEHINWVAYDTWQPLFQLLMLKYVHEISIIILPITYVAITYVEALLMLNHFNLFILKIYMEFEEFNKCDRKKYKQLLL